MPAHLEITGGIVRYSSNPEWKYGDPYELAFYVQPIPHNTVVLKGLAEPARIDARNDIKELLKGYGWTHAKCERIKDGESRWWVAIL